MANAIEQWIEKLRGDYEAPTDDNLMKRVTGWRATGDASALLYQIVQGQRAMLEELQHIKTALEGQAGAKTKK